MDEIGLVFSQVERLQQIRRLEELTGLMCRSHFRLLMRLPDCYTLGSKILNSDARARTIREPPRPAMVPVQRFAPARSAATPRPHFRTIMVYFNDPTLHALTI